MTGYTLLPHLHFHVFETVLDENIGSNNFDFVISGDDLKEGQGKPDP
jgi:hypothetical protein